MEREYAAGFRQVDYVTATEEARREINGWTAEQTRGRIEEIVPPGVLGPLTRLVLTNAVYFRDAWFHPFPARATVEEAFHLEGGDSVEVPTMRVSKDFAYMEDDRVRVVQLPYRGAELSAFVVLPKDRDGLAGLERTLSAGDLERWTRGDNQARKVDLHLPRFRFTSTFELTPALRGLGIDKAFTRAADFSGITAEEPLMISAVLHKAFVGVDENGTEAAAATAIEFQATAMPVPVETVLFRADHPFLFLIRHDASGLILFLGRIADPRED
jgi:serpin B